MNHLKFVEAGLHNRHIRFLLNNTLKQGVVVDDLFHPIGKSKRSHYTFIPTENMVKWKEAEKRGDHETMNSLSTVVDIDDISWGMPIERDMLNREVELVSNRARYLTCDYLQAGRVVM